MRYTLLEIVQDILNEMDSDEVNSIDDTVESKQVAQIVKSTWRNICANRNWSGQRRLIQLDGYSNTERPNYIKCPPSVKRVLSITYNCKTADDEKDNYKELKYKEPDEFLRFVYTRDSTNENVIKVKDFSGTALLIRNDCAPTYYTSFDDSYIVTDSYDKNVDDTLQSSKTQVLAYVLKEWQHTDDAIPDLPEEAFPALIESAKSTAFLTLKQMDNPKAEAESQRQQRWLSRQEWVVHGGIRFPNYGRKGLK